jgi:hypothetical protein
MSARSTAASVTRHAGEVAAQAVLIAAIVAIVGLVLSGVYGPARFITGTGGVDAGGVRQSYAMEFNGFQAWHEPYAFADFDVTRAKADRTQVWVKLHCVDASGKQAIPGADPYAPVRWSDGDPLQGTAAVDSVMNGTSCVAWLTKSMKSSGPTSGWPSMDLTVAW